LKTSSKIILKHRNILAYDVDLKEDREKRPIFTYKIVYQGNVNSTNRVFIIVRHVEKHVSTKNFFRFSVIFVKFVKASRRADNLCIHLELSIISAKNQMVRPHGLILRPAAAQSVLNGCVMEKKLMDDLADI